MGRIKELNIKKLRTYIRRRSPRRAGYFGMAFLVLFSVLSYSLLFKPAPKVKAATIGTSSGAANSGINQRQSVVTSNGNIVIFYNAGSVAPTGLVYSVSSDNGGTWGTAVQVDSAVTIDFSVTIDSSDNIYVAYENFSIYARKLTYVSGTTWTLGSQNSVATSINCVDTISSGQLYYDPSISINSAGTVFIDMVSEYDYGGGGGCPPDYTYITAKSTNLSSWPLFGGPTLTSAESNPVVVSGKARWTVLRGSLYVDNAGTGLWAPLPDIVFPSNASISYGLDQIHILYASGGSILYRSFSLVTRVMSSATTISSNANDTMGGITTDSNKVWAFYRSYVGANSGNIVYKSMSSAGVWDSSSTSITTDNLNNTTITMPARLMNSATVPVIWSVGTANPYTVKSAVISGAGTVTDTGNQTGTLSGSLTGSSGDTIVKCGIWYYNTINIVSGMTIKVCSSNGQTGGILELHANSVTVAGTIDGNGRGMPGGIGFYGTGGGGGLGVGLPSQKLGAAGSSTSGVAGAGSYGGAAGSGGTNASGGAAAGADGTNVSTPATGGSGGAGATGTGGTGILGGYLGIGINGDSSTDETLSLGSGGGSGGSGGSGAGGGGGGMGWGLNGTYVGGTGGDGGAGATGGFGGKGGNGGAYIKIYSGGTLSITGSLVATGQSGSGSSGSTGSAGVGGNCPTNGGASVC
jgi:hypothetical protein